MRKMSVVLEAARLAVAVTLSACTVKQGSSDSKAGGKQVTFLTFETPNLTPQYWDAAIKRVTDQHPDISVKRIVSPTQDRTAYAKQLLQSGQFPDVMIAVSPAGFAEAGDLYAWTDQELENFRYPRNGAVNGKVYQLPANTQTIPVTYYNKDLFAKAGVTAPPTTYPELLDASAKLTAKNITPIVTGGVHDSIGPLVAGIWGTDVYAKNPEWMKQRRAGAFQLDKANLDNSAVTDGLIPAVKGYTPPANVSWTRSSSSARARAPR
jgi:ABC-type glycerol-3-phosphate transport system substrate-binding protein